jgi:hypothetical protein
MTKLAALVLAPVLALAPALLFAQDAPNSPAAGRIIKVIHVQYGNPENIASALPTRPSVFVRGNNALQAVVVQGDPTDVSSIAQSVKELDVPSVSLTARDIELRVFVIGAGPKAQAANNAGPETDPVIKQLQSAFPYPSYELLDTMLLRSREGETARTDGIMKTFPEKPEQHAGDRYAIQYRLVVEPGDPHRTIRLNGFEFRTHSGAPASGDTSAALNIGFQTNLQLHEGQKVVIGKTNIDNGDSALFVVVTAKVLE